MIVKLKPYFKLNELSVKSKRLTPASPLLPKEEAGVSLFQFRPRGFQSTTGISSPNSSGRNRGQTFSVMQMTDAARRLPISQASASVLP